MDIFGRVDEKLTRLKKVRPLPRAVVERLRSELSTEWTYNSNAIEGNTLSLRETRMVLEFGLTVKGKNLREHFEVNNHQKAIELVEDLATSRSELTEHEILDTHRIVLENIEKEYAGRYRTGQVRILGANFVPPNHLKIGTLIEDLVRETNENAANLGDVERFARFHHRFVWIHPFFDGNGRTARLLMNLLFIRLGYPPAIILYNDRRRYYDSLERANNGDYSPFVLLIAQAVERSLDLYLEAAGAFGDEEYIPLSQLAGRFRISQEYLRLLARRGKIDAHKKARNWLSTERAVKEYLSK